MLKRIFKILLPVIIIAAAAFFYFTPEYIDKSKNTVSNKNMQVTRQPWYDSIPFIADLHCDALLWNRNFLKEHNYGHVDLPRLQKANVALQIFAIVGKTPRNMNIEENSDKTDQIGLLSFAQLRPSNTWSDITERALNQCNDLNRFVEKSNSEISSCNQPATIEAIYY